MKTKPWVAISDWRLAQVTVRESIPAANAEALSAIAPVTMRARRFINLVIPISGSPTVLRTIALRRAQRNDIRIARSRSLLAATVRRLRRHRSEEHTSAL